MAQRSNIPVLLSLLIIVLFTVATTSTLNFSKEKMLEVEQDLHSIKEQLYASVSSFSRIIPNKEEGVVLTPTWINQAGYNTQERFILPKGYKREESEIGTFAYFLRNLSLKDHGSPVLLYNGKRKANNIYEAVVSMDIGKKDLQQCADAIIRLRAEYLYQEKKYEKINFSFTNGFEASFDKWIEGNRIKVIKDKVFWEKVAEKGNNYDIFREYLEMVFIYAGTMSLEKDLVPVDYKDMEIGDVFIQGGSPGHAVIVFDLAVNHLGEKVYLLAQSYMPAQEIHILQNPNNSSPWYLLDEKDSIIKTPEWTFSADNLKRFP